MSNWAGGRWNLVNRVDAPQIEYVFNFPLSCANSIDVCVRGIAANQMQITTAVCVVRLIEQIAKRLWDLGKNYLLILNWLCHY
jgi:hypothetical protein